MADGNENIQFQTVSLKGATKHCSFGLCKSDSRYADRKYMENVTWLTFPKPKRQLEKCQRWVRACGRENFTIEKVRKWTYICSKHFVGGLEPTPEHPDPIPATFTPLQTERFSRKRKAPTPRGNPVTKKQLFEASEALLSLQDSTQTSIISTLEDVTDALLSLQNLPSTNEICSEVTLKCNQTTKENGIKEFQNKETQTNFTCNDILAGKIDKIIQRNTADSSSKSQVIKKTKFLQYEKLSQNKKSFKFYTGISVENFCHLFECMGEAVHHLIYWKGSKTRHTSSLNKKRNTKQKLSPKDELILTLVKLRHSFPNRDLAHRFGFSLSRVSEIVNTWIQFLYKQTECVRRAMFPSRQLIKENLPPQFKSFKNVRVIIDCFEIPVESSSDFGEQGNIYSSYKHNTTLKCLVGIVPTGAITFLSDTYEGSISDKEIFRRSGILDVLLPKDLVIADRGFLIREELMKIGAHLNIPPFLCGRKTLTAQEEIITKRIARVRIHVERAIERMKNFKILSTKLPLSLKTTASQVVYIVGFLVNYQAPIVR